MKLWLDDERNPVDPIIQELFGSTGDEIWVKDYFSAIHYLAQGNITEISLDHDLGLSSKTGYDVAKYIEEQAFNGTLPKLIWSVHSMNTVGSKNITKTLQNADKYWANL